MDVFAPFHALQEQLNQRILGQAPLVRRLMIALLADGHLLVEGTPGLAKTRAIKALADGVEGDFHRIQFTPDLLPSDLVGTDIFRPHDGQFQFQPGPIFHNLVLADEINRAPAKVQSALLECMGERQITVGRTTHRLPPLFLVLATQNPIEQEGTYPLPEAQLDRFLMFARVDYPAASTEREILRLARHEALTETLVSQQTDLAGTTPDRANPPTVHLSQTALFSARRAVLELHMAPPLEHYIVALTLATRHPETHGEVMARWVRYGASPRATIALDRCARAHAWLEGRDYVSPADIQAIAPDVLRHRVLLTFEAEADGITPDRLIAELLHRVAVP
jgi:MoxR-like ATPase